MCVYIYIYIHPYPIPRISTLKTHLGREASKRPLADADEEAVVTARSKKKSRRSANVEFDTAEYIPEVIAGETPTSYVIPGRVGLRIVWHMDATDPYGNKLTTRHDSTTTNHSESSQPDVNARLA